MDDETSRASLGSTTSRLTERDEKFRLETQLQDAQSELYQLRRVMPFLENTNPDDPSISFRNLASTCADLREERDSLREQVDTLQQSKREEIQQKDDLIDELRRGLSESREERDRYRLKCQQYERDLSDEESRYYREGINEQVSQEIPQTQIQSEMPTRRPIESSSVDRNQPTRPIRHVNFVDESAARDPHVQSLFNRMDEENSEISVASQQPSRLQNPRQELNFNYEANFTVTDPPRAETADSRTNVAAPNVNEYVHVLKDYRTNVRTLYDQMKSTAQFFVDILRRLGYEKDPQIQLMMEKINQINLNMQDSKNLSHKVLKETKQIGNELVELCRSFDRIPQSVNVSKQNAHDASSSSSNKELEAMLQRKDESLIRLRNEKNGLDNECQKLQVDCNELQHLTSELEMRLEQSKENENKLIEELENRKGIVEQLKLQLGQEYNNHKHEIDEYKHEIDKIKQRLSIQLRNNVAISNLLTEKVQEGAVRSGYVLPDGYVRR